MVKVYGLFIDNEIWCIYYYLFLDVIVIKFKCCNKYYLCYKCYNEYVFYIIERWVENEFDEKVIMCGVCKYEMCICDYMMVEMCFCCKVYFNSCCKFYYYLYFEV